MASATNHLTVKNHRLKMSIGGIITLPVSARKALKMEKGQGCQVTIAVDKNSVILAKANNTGGFRVSPKGLLELRGEAHATLAAGVGRHYWMEIDDNSNTVKLNPFK